MITIIWFGFFILKLMLNLHFATQGCKAKSQELASKEKITVCRMRKEPPHSGPRF